MSSPLRLLPLVVLAVVGADCSEPLDPTGERRPGVIAFYDNPIVVQAPDTVQAGVAFEVGVRTYGNGCISANGTDVRIEGSSVEVWPHDIHSGATACEDLLNMFDHQATVTLEEPGSVQIAFKGKEMPADSVVTIVRTVVVE